MQFNKVFSVFRINKPVIFLFLMCALAGYLMDSALLFLFVFMHELCHGIAGRICGLNVNGILLFPFGGVSEIGDLEYMGTAREIVVSAAGPLFNMASAAFFYLLNKLGIYVPNYKTLIQINIVLAVFNMLPGLPLDGGRILRAVLNYFMGFKKATKVSIISGYIISAVILLTGILMPWAGRMNISFLIMPFFIIYIVRQEERTMYFMIMRDMINKRNILKKNGVMKSRELCVYEDAYPSDVLKHVDLNKYHIIFVINRKMTITGMLTESQIMESLGAEDGDITIGKLCSKINDR